MSPPHSQDYDKKPEYRLLEQKIDNVQADVKEIKEVLRSNYVTQDQYVPVRTLVYGLVSIILLGVIGALLALVIRQPPVHRADDRADDIEVAEPRP